MQRNNVLTPRWGSGGGMDWETGIDVNTLLRIKKTTNENLLKSTVEPT